MEPTPGVTVRFLSGEICEQRSDTPNGAAWGFSTLVGPEPLENSATRPLLNRAVWVQGLNVLGLVVQLPGNIQAWKLLSCDICTEPWMPSEAHGDSHPHSDTHKRE